MGSGKMQITDFCLCPKNKNLILFPVKKSRFYAKKSYFFQFWEGGENWGVFREKSRQKIP